MITTLIPPAAPLIAVDDPGLRQHLELRSGETDNDTLLEALVAAATAKAETYTRRRLLTQTLRVTLDRFSRAGWAGTVLPVAPIQSVDQVQYMDDAGVWQTLEPASYRLVQSMSPGEVWPASGKTWPVPKREPAVVRIDVVAGYGATAADVPPDIVHAVRMLAAHLDQHREAVTTGRDAPIEVPFGVRSFLNPHRIWI